MNQLAHNFFRYSRLYGALLRNGLTRELSFRADFLASFVAQLIWYGATVSFFSVVYGHVSAINGWSFAQVLLLLAVYQLLEMALSAVFLSNFSRLPEMVDQGELDLFLLRPVDAQFLTSVRYVSLPSVLNTIPAVGLAVYALNQLGVWPSPGAFGLFAVFFVMSCAALYAIWFTTMCLVFWLGRIHELHILFLEAFRYVSYPNTIYRGPIRTFLSFAVPILFTVTVPAQAVLGMVEWTGALMLLGTAVVTNVVARAVWKAGLRRYTSASS